MTSIIHGSSDLLKHKLLMEPEVSELAEMIQKQDVVTAELLDQLHVCRRELSNMKQQTVEYATETERLFERLKQALLQLETSPPPVIDATNALPSKPVIHPQESPSENTANNLQITVQHLQRAVALADAAVTDGARLRAERDAVLKRVEVLEKDLSDWRGRYEKEVQVAREQSVRMHQQQIDDLKVQLLSVRDERLKDTVGIAKLKEEKANYEQTHKELSDRLETLTTQYNKQIAGLKQQLYDKTAENTANEEKVAAILIKMDLVQRNAEHVRETALAAQRGLQTEIDVQTADIKAQHDQMITVSEENGRLRSQMQRLTYELETAVQETDHHKRVTRQAVDRLADESKLLTEHNQHQLTEIISEQQRVIGRLKVDFAQLTAQVKTSSKGDRSRIAALQRENDDLVRRLDRLFAQQAVP